MTVSPSYGLPPFELRLKIGAPIMLLLKVDPKKGLGKGTRLTVVQVSSNYILGRILGGPFDGGIRRISRMDVVIRRKYAPYVIIRGQFPLCLCFAMTIHIAQSQTDILALIIVTLCLPMANFIPHFSRATSKDNLFLLLPPDNLSTIENVVYSEALLKT